MELNKIRIILNDAGQIENGYTIIPIVHQYATNYELEVAFLNNMPTVREMKVVFNINGKASPSKLLSPTLSRIKLSENPEVYSYFSHRYKLTQFETQVYQDTLDASIYIYDLNEVQISNINISIPMIKQQYNKLTPAALEDNSSVSSVARAIYDLEAAVVREIGIDGAYSKYETKEEAEAKLEEAKSYTDEKVKNHKEEVDNTLKNYATKNYVDIQDSAIRELLNSRIQELNNRVDNKADTSLLNNYYNKSSVEALIKNAEVNNNTKSYLNSNYYNKTEVNNKIKDFATEAYVNSKVASLVDSSPEALNTLNELAAALGDDPNFAATITKKLADKIDRDEYEAEIGAIDEDLNNLTVKVDGIEGSLNSLSDVAYSGSYNDLADKPEFIVSAEITENKSLLLTSNTGAITEFLGSNGGGIGSSITFRTWED